jgi:hypothetical protein
MSDARDRGRLPLREGQEIHVMAEVGQGPRQVEDGEGRTADLEEGLGGEEQDAEAHAGRAAPPRTGSGSRWRSIHAASARMTIPPTTPATPMATTLGGGGPTTFAA